MRTLWKLSSLQASSAAKGTSRWTLWSHSVERRRLHPFHCRVQFEPIKPRTPRRYHAWSSTYCRYLVAQQFSIAVSRTSCWLAVLGNFRPLNASFTTKTTAKQTTTNTISRYTIDSPLLSNLNVPANSSSSPKQHLLVRQLGDSYRDAVAALIASVVSVAHSSSGIWITATVTSSFYSRCATNPDLLKDLRLLAASSVYPFSTIRPCMKLQCIHPLSYRLRPYTTRRPHAHIPCVIYHYYRLAHLFFSATLSTDTVIRPTRI